MSEKVRGQKGNSPNRRLKFQIIAKEKIVNLTVWEVGLEAAIL